MNENAFPINESEAKAAQVQDLELFPLLSEFLTYMEVILGRQPLTIKEYRYDLVLFFRFIKQLRSKQARDFETIQIKDIDVNFLKDISLTDCYAFLTWLTRERKAGPSNRARKVAALRAFFKYIVHKKKLFDYNPVQELESPKQQKRLPKHLSLEESKSLLQAGVREGEQFPERDYCILTLFLNCGLRLSELSAIRIKDIQEDRLRVIGKGDKERTVYLNGACIDAINDYLDARPKRGVKEEAKPFLFISRQGNRLANSSIQRMIKQSLKAAGLDTTKYSTHKLRHTAATLMYQYGQVDIRLLQQILGHSSVSTTEIYTHIDDANLHAAIEKNPLASERNR